MRKFDTKIQYLKYKVLRAVARQAWNGSLLETISDIPKMIIPGTTPTMRCCVYKERAILTERVKLAIGGDKRSPNVIQVIDIACDECPVGGYEVTNACRGCLAHRCEDACRKGAISFDSQQKAVIDKNKCVECGMCAKVCPYSAIHSTKRPCINACKIKAISMSETRVAKIDDSKCTACGACVYQCPFGAISEKSFILDVIDLLLRSRVNLETKVFALVAPSISSQFTYARLGQVVSGIRALGFHAVVEAALGADMVAAQEARELQEKGFLTSSCCPAFVQYVKTQFPTLAGSVSSTLSPMALMGKYLKELLPGAKVVFIGPCTAKKMEYQTESVSPYIDSVITFEELQALLDSRDLDITAMDDSPLEGASYFGRIFAHSGGVTTAIRQSLDEQGLTDFAFKPVTCDGIEACRTALLKASRGMADGNFIEGMACTGGCVGGAGCLTHAERNRMEVDKYSQTAQEKRILEAVAAAPDLLRSL